MKLATRIKHLLIGLDQFLWVLLTLGGGSPDETISAASWRLEQEGRLFGRVMRPVIDWLASPWEADHCWRSYQSEQLRAQLPAQYRRGA